MDPCVRRGDIEIVGTTDQRNENYFVI